MPWQRWFRVLFLQRRSCRQDHLRIRYPELSHPGYRRLSYQILQSSALSALPAGCSVSFRLSVQYTDFHSVGRMHLWEILLFSGSPGILLHPESMLYSSPVRLLLPADIIPDSRQYSGIMPTDFLLLSYTYIIPFLLRYSVPHRQM